MSDTTPGSTEDTTMKRNPALLALVFSLTASPAWAAEYTLAVEPNYPPAQAEQVYKPLLDYLAKSTGHTSSVFILGGGSPKNFMLQTEPQIQEVMGIQEKGHDYFLQCTDARPDTGGLSGATPAEAVSWGKVDPDKLPDSVVCYTDSTIALPLLTAYVTARVKPRKLKRLYDHRDAILGKVREKYLKIGTVDKVLTSRKVAKRSSSIGLKKA